MSSPPHASEPGARRLNGNHVVGQKAWRLGVRWSFPSIEPEPGARGVDARWATEVLAKIQQDVDQTMSHFARRSEGARMVAMMEYVALAMPLPPWQSERTAKPNDDRLLAQAG